MVRCVPKRARVFVFWVRFRRHLLITTNHPPPFQVARAHRLHPLTVRREEYPNEQQHRRYAKDEKPHPKHALAFPSLGVEDVERGKNDPTNKENPRTNLTILNRKLHTGNTIKHLAKDDDVARDGNGSNCNQEEPLVHGHRGQGGENTNVFHFRYRSLYHIVTSCKLNSDCGLGL